jgi:hypothetical protein
MSTSEDYKYKNWVFTLGADKEDFLIDAEVLQKFLKEEMQDFVFQLEIGHKVGTRHYQGCFSTKIRTRQPTLLKRFLTILTVENLPSLTIDRMLGNWSHNIDYCSKADTRVGSAIYMSDSLEKYSGNDINFLNDKNSFYPWQKTIHNEIFDSIKGNIKTPNDRSIIWICDTHGNSGKSKYVKFLCFNNTSIIKVPFGSAAQMRSACIQAGPKKVYIVDIPRTMGDDDSLNSIISVLEDIKNGHITSSFYGKITTLICQPPHVLVFSNQRCPTTLMSEDRWRALTIMSANKEIYEFKCDI